MLRKVGLPRRSDGKGEAARLRRREENGKGRPRGGPDGKGGSVRMGESLRRHPPWRRPPGTALVRKGVLQLKTAGDCRRLISLFDFDTMLLARELETVFVSVYPGRRPLPS